jgi:hypothetical protein
MIFGSDSCAADAGEPPPKLSRALLWHMQGNFNTILLTVVGHMTGQQTFEAASAHSKAPLMRVAGSVTRTILLSVVGHMNVKQYLSAANTNSTTLSVRFTGCLTWSTLLNVVGHMTVIQILQL